MELMQYYMTENPCYAKPKLMKPQGIVVHDTNAGNPYLYRYIEPDDGIIGSNKYHNGWNKPTATKMVHAFIGLDMYDHVRTYNVLPWDYKCWGCGGGYMGSYNNTHIQFEICDDGYKKDTYVKDEKYFNAIWKEAVELCAYLCKMWKLKSNDIVSHKEAHNLGYASNHSDTSVWFGMYGKDMNDFRADVEKLLSNTTTVSDTCYLLYGAGSRARKLMYLPENTEVVLTGRAKNGYHQATVTMTYTGYIKDENLHLEGGGETS